MNSLFSMSQNLRFVFLLFFIILGSAGLRAEHFVIDLFDVKIEVSPEGYFDVTETIEVTFSERRHGLFRIIPYRYRIKGEEVKVRIHDIEVEGRKFEKKFGGGNLEIKIGDKDEWVNGEQRYRISYRVERAFLFEEEYTQFYWNFTGTEWPVPIIKATYSIQFANLPDFQEGEYAVFTGSRGEQGKDATIAVDGAHLSGQSTRRLAIGEGITVAAKLPKDYIAKPADDESLGILDYGLFAIPLALLSFLFSFWWKKGRNPSFTEMVHYYPPEGLPAAEAGAFIDDSADNRDIICLIPQWGQQGYIKLREVEEKGILFNSTDYLFLKQKDLPSTAPDYEQTIFRALFAGREEVAMSELKDEFHTYMSSARKELTAHVQKNKYYTDESLKWYSSYWTIGLLIFCIIGGIALIIISAALRESIGIVGPSMGAIAGGAGLILCGGIGFILQRNMLRKNEQGMQVFQQLHGFQTFVKKADKDRLERLLKDDPTYFDKTLPYAIAFGMAKRWAKNFDGLFTEPPGWYDAPYLYHGGNTGFYNHFADNFDSGMREIESTFNSTPSSSGDGGGGFSGGGFGGGGGGSW